MTLAVLSDEGGVVEAESEAAPRILVVDDDEDLRNLIANYLRQNGMAVTVASRTVEMEACLREKGPFDLAVLDVMMPDEDGISFVRRLDPSERPPIIFLSAMGALPHRITGLEAGGDDYIAKPCNPRELLARVRAILARCLKREAPSDRRRFGDWTLDHHGKSVSRQLNLATALTDAEHNILCTFLNNPRRVCSRPELARALRSLAGDDPGRSVDVLVSRLRKKLGRNAPIRTVRNEGYMFTADVEAL
ncbi:MAG TPA: response regulator transcription factor [Sphingobium sp.]|uniref:response regulator transcription factor n=1 Tax=Sphingobium sp. TaxID=1912891 RepID=UPI002ED05158